MIMDLRRILSSPSFLNLLYWLMGSPRFRKFCVDAYIKPNAGDRVVDLGCGTAEIASYMPTALYTGIDPNPQYIAGARRRLGQKAVLVTADPVQDANLLEGKYDIALLLGVLHHLDDASADTMLGLARRLLRPGGRLVTHDIANVKGRGWLERLLVRMDRGQHVRQIDSYPALARRHFQTVDASVHQGLLTIPYTHVFMVCS
jgi:SAM-dependent methyltransferase